MSLLAVTVGSDPSAVVDDVRAVGWYGVNVYHRLACSGGCYDALSSVDAVDACCDTCGLRPVVEVSLYAQPGMIATCLRAWRRATCLCLRATHVYHLFCLRFPVRCGRAFWRALVAGVSLWWRLARAVVSGGVWRSPRLRLASCCVVAAREGNSRTATAHDW